MAGKFILRGIIILIFTAAGYLWSIPQNPAVGAGIGTLLALAVIGAEYFLRKVALSLLLGGIGGILIGSVAAVLLSIALSKSGLGPSFLNITIIALILIFCYLGITIGSYVGGWLGTHTLKSLVGARENLSPCKIIDTSVIIDGRIADICEAGFIEGEVVVPEFILAELQYIADSADSIKRNRGRKGLDVLQKLKKNKGISVTISEVDFPELKEVDAKLVQLTRRLGGKLVTNDFNLNKVAGLRGIDVLNINELANSMKPVVLPGENMEVFILKEGKEKSQGVAYLDDGTMVVVDEARKNIGETVEIVVTSVLQTTAGKMIFGELSGESTIGRPGEYR